MSLNISITNGAAPPIEPNDDWFALSYAGAYLAQVNKIPFDEVTRVMNDGSNQRMVIEQLGKNPDWSDLTLPWLKAIYGLFCEIGERRQKQTLRRLFPNYFEKRESTEIERDREKEIFRTTKRVIDPLWGLSVYDRFLWYLHAIVRVMKDPQKLTTVLLAMND